MTLFLFCLESKIKHGMTKPFEMRTFARFCLESKIKHGITQINYITILEVLP